MKIAILSDFHFGFGAGTEREEDPYEAVKEALEKAKDSDLILLGGDIFDNRNPNAETLTRAMELLLGPLLGKSEAKLVRGAGKDIGKVSRIALMGIPVVAIHGTHERRTKGLLNPVEALEKAGFLIYLHCNSVIFGKNGEKVAVSGMSGVPDQYAESVLKNWNPKPFEGCFNILILHQSISEFLYAPHTLDLKALPKGFDLYVDGHVHEARKAEYSGRPFLLTGSLIPTQLREESARPKGFWTFETSTGGTSWVPLDNQRKVYYRAFESPDFETIERELKKILGEEQSKKPIVRINMKGKVKDTLTNEIESRFGGKAILSFRKETRREEIPARTMEEHKLSVEEMGRKFLLENLEKSGLDPEFFEDVFDLLAEGRTEDVTERMLKAPGIKEAEKTEKQERKTEEKKSIKSQRTISSYGQVRENP
jgi:DNA repair exonuclease SbcCD nuclease subunit